MKTSTEPLDQGPHATAQNQTIICGGGWKNPPKEYHLKIKAICGALLTVTAAAAGIYYYDAFGMFAFLPTVVLLITTILLARFERWTAFIGRQDGEHDIRNLYGQSCARHKKNGEQEPNDNKVAIYALQRFRFGFRHLTAALRAALLRR